jgi:hypothetical protein
MYQNPLRLFPLLVLIVLLPPLHLARAQEQPREPLAPEPAALRGVIASDFLAPSMPSPFAEEQPQPERKSVPVAAALSAILPGAGQIYAEAPAWRAVLYAGIEALGWTAYAVTSAKGSSLTREFEGYADAHWSVVRYIDWLAANYTRWSDSAVNKQDAAEALARIYTSTDASRPEWERIDFEQLNRLERAVREGFSHTLPPHGHQQYYEEIGKYVQYRAGWDDHSFIADTVIYDPSRVTERNLSYMEKRADANDYLGYASTALGGIILNHLASLLDAALTTRAYNASIRAELKGSLLPDPERPLYAALGLTLRF